VADGQVAPFAGDLDEYREWLQGQRREQGEASPDAKPEAPRGSNSRKQQRRDGAAARAQAAGTRAPLVNKLSKLERQIEDYTREKAELETLLGGTEIYAEDAGERLQAAIARSKEVAWQLAEHEHRWLALQEELDALSG